MSIISCSVLPVELGAFATRELTQKIASLKTETAIQLSQLAYFVFFECSKNTNNSISDLAVIEQLDLYDSVLRKQRISILNIANKFEIFVFRRNIHRAGYLRTQSH